MTSAMYQKLVQYMKSNMKDAAHDQAHVYRVLHTALRLAASYPGVNTDVLIASCLLHDIGREAQFHDPTVCHAQAGSEMAFHYLLELRWEYQAAAHVRACISTHRFRSSHPPESLEAKLLFDADKLDVTGAIGVARTLVYQGQIGTPICTTDATGEIHPGTRPQDPESFFREYHFKLKNVHHQFYTPEAQKLAQQREPALHTFYTALWDELKSAQDSAAILSLLLE